MAFREAIDTVRRPEPHRDGKTTCPTFESSHSYCMIRRTPCCSGLALALLAVQSIAAPLGACAEETGSHENGAHEMAMSHGAEADMAHATDMASEHSEESHHAPDSQTADCMVLAACGAPAVGTSYTPTQLAVGDLSTSTLQGIADEPAAIILGLTTPPPKI